MTNGQKIAAATQSAVRSRLNADLRDSRATISRSEVKSRSRDVCSTEYDDPGGSAPG